LGTDKKLIMCVRTLTSAIYYHEYLFLIQKGERSLIRTCSIHEKSIELCNAVMRHQSRLEPEIVTHCLLLWIGSLVDWNLAL
jgi:hypothetical protein